MKSTNTFDDVEQQFKSSSPPPSNLDNSKRILKTEEVVEATTSTLEEDDILTTNKANPGHLTETRNKRRVVWAIIGLFLVAGVVAGIVLLTHFLKEGDMIEQQRSFEATPAGSFELSGSGDVSGDRSEDEKETKYAKYGTGSSSSSSSSSIDNSN